MVHYSIRLGDLLPDFELISTTGKLVSKKSIAGKTVLFFIYPKDDTASCTREAQNFSNYKTHLEDYSKDIQVSIVNSSINNLTGQKQVLTNQKNTFFIKEKIINLHKSNLFDKYSFPLASIILFFVGAPLGALIRKGGFGLPMVVSLILFLTYHFVGTFSKNAAEDGSMMHCWVVGSPI